MSIITKFLAVVTEPQFKLARDLTAMAIADGQVTPEEKEAISEICHLEGIDETKLLEALQGGYDHVNEEMPKTHEGREAYLRDIIKLIGADGYAAPQEVYLFQIIAGRMGPGNIFREILEQEPLRHLLRITSIPKGKQKKPIVRTYVRFMIPWQIIQK